MGAGRFISPQLLAALGGGLLGVSQSQMPGVQPFASLPGMGLPTNWALGKKPAPLLSQAPAAAAQQPVAAAPQSPSIMDYVARVRENR